MAKIHQPETAKLFWFIQYIQRISCNSSDIKNFHMPIEEFFFKLFSKKEKFIQHKYSLPSWDNKRKRHIHIDLWRDWLIPLKQICKWTKPAPICRNFLKNSTFKCALFYSSVVPRDCRHFFANCNSYFQPKVRVGRSWASGQAGRPLNREAVERTVIARENV